MLRGLLSLLCVLTVSAVGGGPDSAASPRGSAVPAAEAHDPDARGGALPRELPFFYDLYTFRVVPHPGRCRQTFQLDTNVRFIKVLVSNPDSGEEVSDVKVTAALGG